jgi:hypothetical protein
MDHTRCESSDCLRVSRRGNRAIGFHSIRDFLADSDYVTDVSGVVGPHRNLS